MCMCCHVCTGAWLAGNFVCGSVGLVVEGDGLFDERSRERLGGGGFRERERGERDLEILRERRISVCMFCHRYYVQVCDEQVILCAKGWGWSWGEVACLMR